MHNGFPDTVLEAVARVQSGPEIFFWLCSQSGLNAPRSYLIAPWSEGQGAWRDPLIAGCRGVNTVALSFAERVLQPPNLPATNARSGNDPEVNSSNRHNGNS